MPQSSVQIRLYVPTLSGVTTNVLSTPSASGSRAGTASRLIPHSGTQNECSTSSAVRCTSSCRSTGTWSSCVVTSVALAPVPIIFSG